MDAWSERIALIAIVWAIAGSWILYSEQGIYEDHRHIQAAMSTPLTVSTLVRPRGLSTSWTWLQARLPIVNTPVWFRLSTWLLTGLVSVLVYLLARGLGLSGWVAGGVMALHPLNVETIATISGRSEAIAALGVVTACVLALRPVRIWTALSMALAVLVGVGGKESAIAAVALVPLVLWMTRKRAVWAVAVIAGVALIATSAWSISHIGEYSGVAVTGWQWLEMQGTATVRLFALSIVPWPQTLDYDYDALPHLWRVWCLTVLGMVTVTTLYLWRSHRAVAFGLTWALIVALPRLIVHTPRSYVNEHQWYLALVGVALALDGLLRPQESHV